MKHGHSLSSTATPREDIAERQTSGVRCWLIVALVFSVAVCGCRRQQHGTRQEVRQRVKYYCSALLLAHDAHQEAQLFRDMLTDFQEIPGYLVIEVWVRDRKTGYIYPYPGNQYRRFQQPLSVFLDFRYLEQAGGTVYDLGFALFPPHSIDNLAILYPNLPH